MNKYHTLVLGSELCNIHYTNKKEYVSYGPVYVRNRAIATNKHIEPKRWNTAN
jgi:hypothetical protein